MLKKILAGVSAITLLLAFALQVSASAVRTHGPIIKNKNGTSTNWSGYASTTGGATDVTGSWVVPNLTCTAGQNTYSSAWVGIDGDGSSTVEQIGTEHDCINGQPSYYAWYEMYPKPGRKIPVTVSAGATMNARVRYAGNGNFVLTLNGYSTTQKSMKAQRASAEWIMEAPWSGGVLPLANFGTIGFNGPVGTYSNLDRIDMVNSSGSLKAQTSALDSTGTNFSVTWKSSN